MIPHLQSGGGFSYLPSTWDQSRGIIAGMQRFQLGEQVLVSQFMGTSYPRPRCAVVTKVYGSASSSLFDYVVQVVGTKPVPVRDAWLAPLAITITEAMEWSDSA